MATETTFVPVDVALSLVTGRRLEADANTHYFAPLIARLNGGPVGLEEFSAPEIFQEIQRRAALVFPELAGEDGAELDGPYPIGWLYVARVQQRLQREFLRARWERLA